MSEQQKQSGSNEPKSRSAGNWTAIGLALGAAIGLLLDNLAIGVALGLVIGVAVDAAQRNKNK